MKKDKHHIKDVEQPGKSAPPETSKPVIAGNRPLLKKDPMVVDEGNEENEQAPQAEKAQNPTEKEVLSASGQVTLEPLPDSPKPKPAAEAGPTMPTEAEAAQAKKETEAAQPSQKKQADQTTAADVQRKHQAAVAKLIGSKQYALPITEVTEGRNRRALLIGGTAAIVLILAWVNIALDAGIISLGGLQPFTHFFSN